MYILLVIALYFNMRYNEIKSKLEILTKHNAFRYGEGGHISATRMINFK